MSEWKDASELPDTGTISIATEPDESGDFHAVVSIDQDTSFALTRESVQPYLDACVEAGVRAAYDAAVVRQMTKSGVPLEDVQRVVTDLREQREPMPTVMDVRLEPIVNADHQGIVSIFLRDKQIGQFSAKTCREHALYLLEVLAVAPIDKRYFSLLTEDIGLEHGTAFAMLGDLKAFVD